MKPESTSGSRCWKSDAGGRASPHLQEEVLGSIRGAVGDPLQASLVAVEGRGPLDGAVALLRAGLRVGGP